MALGANIISNQENIYYTNSDSTIRLFEIYKYENKFKSEYERKSEEGKYIKGNLNEDLNLFISTLNWLICIEPDVLGIELTNDKSVYYTLYKNEYTFFIQQYLKEDDENNIIEDFLITTYKENKKIESYFGNMYDGLSKLNRENQLLFQPTSIR